MSELSIEEQIEIIKEIIERKEDFWSESAAKAKWESRVFSWDAGYEIEK